VCYTPTWNYVAQPAASVPAGLDGDGLPMAIQLAGPPNNETTIISLAAQLETARSWEPQRPAPARPSRDQEGERGVWHPPSRKRAMQ
jgi:amidase